MFLKEGLSGIRAVSVLGTPLVAVIPKSVFTDETFKLMKWNLIRQWESLNLNLSTRQAKPNCTI